jgi:carbon-monoxide dehydrogenase medium subunit
LQQKGDNMAFSKFEYFAPDSIQEALKFLQEGGKGTHLLAGGTDIMVKLNHGLLKPRKIIGLKRIKGLNGISFNRKDGLTIGATALLADVAAHPAIRRYYPAVAYAAQSTANVQIRNMGTVAGNLCNAAPSADNAPTLIALSAEVSLAGTNAERRLPLEQFFKGPGQTALKPVEILTAIHVPPPPPHSGASYIHLSARGRVDISAVSVGAMLVMNKRQCSEARIVLGAVAPIPLRAVKSEKLIRGKPLTEGLMEKTGAQASKEAKPISDMRASAQYRKKMVAVLTKRALSEASQRAMRS